MHTDTICDGDPPDQTVTHPFDGNCSLYWECDGGEATLLVCPPGLWYNDVINSCDFPTGDVCDSKIFSIKI